MPNTDPRDTLPRLQAFCRDCDTDLLLWDTVPMAGRCAACAVWHYRQEVAVIMARHIAPKKESVDAAPQ
jgi:hypothetical protein